MKKAVRIEIEYDDGSIDKAEGDAAAQIVAWYSAGESMNIIHGAAYRGSRFETFLPTNGGPE